MHLKDYFSSGSDRYARYRPQYPQGLYDFLLEQTPGYARAWDCATGNGQVARALAPHFGRVYGTDISEQQLRYAFRAANIDYSVTPAEQTQFAAGTFDLIAAGQAAHWFTLEAFYQEVRRVAKPGAILALWGYGLVKVSEEVDPLIREFYTDVVGPYWDEARRLIDDRYQSLPFPFAERTPPKLAMHMAWDLSHLEGYLNTWSAVKAYQAAHPETNPVSALITELANVWPPGKTLMVQFPIFLRVGSV